MKTNILYFIITTLIMTFGAGKALAEGPDFDSAFRDGVKNYQDKKYDAAKISFKKAMELNPRNVSVLTNLAMTHQQLGEKGWALALLKRAAFLNPDFSTTAAALDFISPQLESSEIPHEIRFVDTLHATLFLKYPAWIFSLATALFIFLFFWQLLRFLGARKRAYADETARPAISIKMVLSGMCAISLTTLLILKLIDQQATRATVVESKLSVLSLPEEKAPSLFEIHQGLEVIVNKTQNGWFQITYPGGLSGWVPQNTIFITNGGL